MQDLPKLILALAHRHREVFQPIESVEGELVQFLQSQPLLGNVRELENTVQRMLFCKESGTSLGLVDWLAQTSAEPVPARIDAEADAGLLDQAAGILWKAVSNGVPYKLALREVENKLLEMAVNAEGGTRRQIARRLGTSERTLYSKMRDQRRVLGESPV
jgi:two-component system response regulator HydG